jgi:23S rRNA pseudouridine2605 synthase
MPQVRLQKYLAECGIASRRSSENLILAGRVSVNGAVCEVLGTTIDPQKDSISLDGKKVLLPEHKQYILLNKPEGYMVSRFDPHQTKTIYTLLPEELGQLHPVGRLDQNSCGLLLLTNDGDLTEKLLHPRFKLEKVYKVQVKGKATDLALSYMRSGVDLSDGKTEPARVVRLRQRSENTWIEFGLREGRNRQIRRMCRSVGLDVVTLQRTAFGPLELGHLPVGAWRELSAQEIQTLLKKTADRSDKNSRKNTRQGTKYTEKASDKEAQTERKYEPRQANTSRAKKFTPTDPKASAGRPQRSKFVASAPDKSPSAASGKYTPTEGPKSKFQRSRFVPSDPDKRVRTENNKEDTKTSKGRPLRSKFISNSPEQAAKTERRYAPKRSNAEKIEALESRPRQSPKSKKHKPESTFKKSSEPRAHAPARGKAPFPLKKKRKSN